MKVSEHHTHGLLYIMSLTIANYVINFPLYIYNIEINFNILLIVINSLLLTYLIIVKSLRINSRAYVPKDLESRSLAYTLAFLLPLYLISLIILFLEDFQRITEYAKPGFIEVWTPSALFYALIHWSINGIIVGLFYIAYSYELFHDLKRYSIAIPILVFALNYNVPLLSGYWNPWDIIFYGGVFTYTYSRHRNVLALILVYLISEEPLWWTLLYPLDIYSIPIYYISRTVLGVTASLYLLRKRFPKLIMWGISEKQI